MKSFFILGLATLLMSTFSTAQTFNGATGVAADMQTTSFAIPVNGLPGVMDTSTFGLEKVCLSLVHPSVRQLTIRLTAPNGNSIILFNSDTGPGGPDFSGTCIDGSSEDRVDLVPSPRSGDFKGHRPIGYLNDGSNPNGNWLVTIKDGYPGDAASLNALSLTFGNSPASYFSLRHSQLPIMLIQTSAEIVDEPKVMADMKLIDNGQGNTNHVTDVPNGYNGKIGIELRGDASASFPQKPYAIELWDNSGNEIKQSLLGMPEETDWVLISNYNDKSFSRNVLAQRLFGQMGHYAVRCRLVEVVLNDHYNGIYLLMEKIKRDANRVDIPKLEPTEVTGIDRTGGYIFKFEYSVDSPGDHFNLGHVFTPMMYYYPKPEVITSEQKTYLHQYLADFESTLYSTQFSDPVNGFRKFIKEESFIDYMLMTEFTMNSDGYNKSRYFSKKKDNPDGSYSEFKAGPVWDFDWAMKYFQELPEQVQGLGYMGDWYGRMMEDPVFVDEVRCRYNVLRADVLSNTNIDFILDSVADLVNESKDWYFDCWGNLKANEGEVYSSQTYAEEMQHLKMLLHARLAWLDDYLPGSPVNCNLSTDESGGSQPIVSPNPFHEIIRIHWDEDFSAANIQLKDASGRVVLTWKNVQPVGGSLALDVASDKGLSEGMYYLVIEKNEGTSMVKLVRGK